jgi:hypothetical protein
MDKNDLFYKSIVDFAKASYEYELGTKKAVDEGIMSMEELTIYHYINASFAKNMTYYNSEEERKGLYEKAKEKAFDITKDFFNISELEAKTIFDKVRKIPRS